MVGIQLREGTIARQEEIQKRLEEIEAALNDVRSEIERCRPPLEISTRPNRTALEIAARAGYEALYREQKRLMDERSHLQRELENLGKPKPPRGVELIDAEEADSREWGDLHLVLTERDADGQVESRTYFASFSDMKALDSLGPRLAQLCLETAHVALACSGSKQA